jgi:hypothetical protein
VPDSGLGFVTNPQELCDWDGERKEQKRVWMRMKRRSACDMFG